MTICAFSPSCAAANGSPKPVSITASTTKTTNHLFRRELCFPFIICLLQVIFYAGGFIKTGHFLSSASLLSLALFPYRAQYLLGGDRQTVKPNADGLRDSVG